LEKSVPADAGKNLARIKKHNNSLEKGYLLLFNKLKNIDKKTRINILIIDYKNK
jgi:hypothetical protein